MSGADLTSANLSFSELIEADLTGARLFKADLCGSTMKGIYMDNAYFLRARLNWADLSGSYLQKSQLSRTEHYGANLTGTDLSESDLTRSCMLGSNLKRANLDRAKLDYADLSGADLRGIPGRNETNLCLRYWYKHLRCGCARGKASICRVHRCRLKQGQNIGSPAAWPGTLPGRGYEGGPPQERQVRSDPLKNVSLAGAALRGARLTMTMMVDVDLEGANLERISYDQFTLESISRAKLDGARMSDDLRSAMKALGLSKY